MALATRLRRLLLPGAPAALSPRPMPLLPAPLFPARRDGFGPDGTRARVQIVVTPGSGEGRALDTARSLERALVARGYGTNVRTFADLGSLLRWAATCEATFSHLVCVGGDSTQSAAAAAALRLAVPLVPVPNGFGNMFARAFGHRDAPEAVLALLQRGEIRRIDVGRAGDDLFVSHRSYGPLQQVEEAVERGREHLRIRLLRRLAYYMMAGRYVIEAPLPSIRVEVDGVLVADDAVLVTVANVETYRGFLSLTPRAVPTDGLFDVFVMRRATKPRVWMRLLKLWLGVGGRWDGVTLCRGRRVRVAVNGTAPEEIRVLARALPVLVPAGSVERLAERWAAAIPPACSRAPAAALSHRLTRPGGARARLPGGGGRPLRPARGGRSRSTPPVGHGARG